MEQDQKEKDLKQEDRWENAKEQNLSDEVLDAEWEEGSGDFLEEIRTSLQKQKIRNSATMWKGEGFLRKLISYI